MESCLTEKMIIWYWLYVRGVKITKRTIAILPFFRSRSWKSSLWCQSVKARRFVR